MAQDDKALARDALKRLARLSRSREIARAKVARADQEIRDLAAQARDAGAQYTEIGDAAGMTPQGARWLAEKARD